MIESYVDIDSMVPVNFNATEATFKACLHVPSPSLPVKTDHLTDREGSEPDLSIKQSIPIHTM